MTRHCCLQRRDYPLRRVTQPPALGSLPLASFSTGNSGGTFPATSPSKSPLPNLSHHPQLFSVRTADILKMACIEALPLELLTQIVSYLDTPPPSQTRIRCEPRLKLFRTPGQPIKSLAECSKDLRRLLLPSLFKHARLNLTKAFSTIEGIRAWQALGAPTNVVCDVFRQSLFSWLICVRRKIFWTSSNTTISPAQLLVCLSRSS